MIQQKWCKGETLKKTLTPHIVTPLFCDTFIGKWQLKSSARDVRSTMTYCSTPTLYTCSKYQLKMYNQFHPRA